MKKCFLMLVVAFAAVGCGEGVVETDGEATGAESLQREVADEGLLAFVNNPATDLETLDVYVNIDLRAARSIVQNRPFASIADLDASPYVGPVTFDRLRSFATGIGFIPRGSEGTYDGVALGARDAEEIVEIANLATQEQLRQVGLDARQVRNVIAARPIASAQHLATVSYVGRSAMAKLQAFVPVWTGKRMVGDGALYDGVPFGRVDQEIALEILNHASYEQLVVVGGFYQYGAKLTVAGRPYADVSAWSSTPGIGRGTSEQLLGYARSLRWTRIDQPAPTTVVIGVEDDSLQTQAQAGTAVFAITGAPGSLVDWAAVVVDWRVDGTAMLDANGVCLVEVTIPAAAAGNWDTLILWADYSVQQGQ